MAETESKRLFIAIFPPAHLLAGPQEAAARLAKMVSTRAVRWVQPDKLHLTLNFLGSVDIVRVGEIQASLKAACDGCRQHSVRIAGLGCFPNVRRPRIIWAGLSGDLRPLEGLKKSLDAHLSADGFLCDDRAFYPHLTIGRVSSLTSVEQRQFGKTLDEEKERDFGEWKIESINLMESALSAQGATYRALRSVGLANP